MTNLIALPSGTELVGDYRIDRVLGAGGFGVTYLADELALGRPVTIKEYFPADFAARAGAIEAAPRSKDCDGDYKWGLERFIEEAQTLARFSHPNIVRVYRYFRANNTGYMVLHFEEGQSLKSWLQGLRRAPRQAELDRIVSPLLDALELIHRADYLHRDIAPDNIIIRKNGDPVLIDFGSARGEIASHSKTVSALVKPGYSPYEQYAETSRQQGPWTDIYALAATLYHAVTGKRPPDAPSRMVKDEIVPARDAAVGAFRPGFLSAIDRALQLSVESRPQSVAAWRGDLLAPEPAKPSWLARQRQKSDQGPLEAAATKSDIVAPPQPDAPGPQGGLLDFVEGLKKKTATKKPAKVEKAAAVEPPAAQLAAAPTAKIANSPAQPEKPSKPRAQKRATQLPAIIEKKKVAPPRPLKKKRSWSWRPVMFKLLIGIGFAATAVMLQERVEQQNANYAAGLATAALPPAPAYLAEVIAEPQGGSVLAYSADGKSIVTAGAEGVLKIWDAESLTLTKLIPGGSGAALSLAIQGDRALTTHAGGHIIMWDLARGEKALSFQRNEAELTSAIFLGDTQHFASASRDSKIALWDVAAPNTPQHVLEGHESAIETLAFVQTDNGRMLLSGSADRTARLWNLETMDVVRTYRGHRDVLTAATVSPDQRAVAVSTVDGSVRLWSSQSGRLLRVFHGHRSKVTSVAFSVSGDLLASSSDDGTVRLWDIKRARTAKTLTGLIGGAKSVAFAPDGQKLATLSAGGTLRIWALPLARIARN